MRKAVFAVTILLVLTAFVAILGPEFAGDTFIGDIGRGIREIVSGIADAIGFSVRGFSPSG